jgi:hypothetical protein
MFHMHCTCSSVIQHSQANCAIVDAPSPTAGTTVLIPEEADFAARGRLLCILMSTRFDEHKDGLRYLVSRKYTSNFREILSF